MKVESTPHNKAFENQKKVHERVPSLYSGARVQKEKAMHLLLFLHMIRGGMLSSEKPHKPKLSFVDKNAHTQNIMSLSFILVCVLYAHSTSNRFSIFSHQSQLKGDPVSFFHQFYMLAFTCVVFMCQ